MQIGVLGKEETEPVQFVPEELYVPYIANKHPYLLNRGISPAVIEYFKVGYNPDTGNVIFPVMDSEGNCLLIQRRSVSYKFFNNDESPYKGLTLYGYDKVLSHIREGSHLDLSTVYVVESAIDALYLWSYGKLAVALLQGVPTKEQIELLNALPVRVVVASQDTDETGMLGAWLLKTRLNDSKLVKRVVFPKTNDITGKAIKDINDLSSLQIQSISSTIVIQKPKDKRGKYNGK
jgi:DNA primase